MISSSPSKILLGIPLDAIVSIELLSWAIRVLARPGDSIIALHVIETMETKSKRHSTRKQQKQIRQAKSFVINIMGELVKTCQSIDVNMEARVGVSSSAGQGLIEEGKNTGADYLVIGRNRSNRASLSAIFNYCCKNVPQGCSLLLLRPTPKLQQDSCVSSFKLSDLESESSNSSWSEKNLCNENSFSSNENESMSSSHVKFKTTSSPKTVLDICDEDLDSDQKSSNSSESSRKTVSMSPLKTMMSSFFRPSCDWTRILSKKNPKGNQQPMVRCFTYQEIAIATKHFHTDNMVGQGGYSQVYKGEIRDGSHIAVKRLAKDNNINANKEKEFLMELGIIGHVNHPNTAKLVGYCIENGLYLIFQLYPNGTLSSALHGEEIKGLEWHIRYRIVMGIAKGLHYLHKCCKHRIIHRDIKASNVLLGPDYEPQISDFGLAKWLPSKWSHHAVIPIEGTFGYLAPEYFMHGIVDEKTDIFAFGILLLEIITGRLPVDSNGKNLLFWARPLMESGNLRELADPRMKDRFDMEQLYRVALTASFCVRQSSIWRPSMTEVLQLLKYGQDSDVGSSWRIPKFTSDEMDDYSMIFGGYQLPSNLTLDDI